MDAGIEKKYFCQNERGARYFLKMALLAMARKGVRGPWGSDSGAWGTDPHGSPPHSPAAPALPARQLQVNETRQGTTLQPTEGVSSESP